MTDERKPGQPPRTPAGMGYGDDAKATEFDAFLERHAGEKHLIAMQDYPDPDAIASALGYRVLAAAHGIESTIFYEGRISHQENQALTQILDLDITRFTDDTALEEWDGVVYVDNQGTTTRLMDRCRAAQIPTFAIIDHHTPQNVLTAEFTDIRPVGAAATIVTDYLELGHTLQLDATSQEHIHLATALVHALRSETNGFIRAGPEEHAAAAYLSHFHDPALLESILQVQRSHGTMDVIRTALTEREIHNGFSFAGVGYVGHGDRDAIPQAADFLLTEENVHTVVVYGILQGGDDREVAVGSVRTSRITLDVDEFVKDALGADASGRFYGGGRHRAGGFEIPIGFLEGAADPEQQQLKWDAFAQQIHAKLLAAAGSPPAKAEPGTEAPGSS